MGQHYIDYLERTVNELSMNKKQLQVAYDELKERYDRVNMLVNQLFFDKNQVPFICGVVEDPKEENTNHMPKYFMICPAYGSDAIYRYERKDNV